MKNVFSIISFICVAGVTFANAAERIQERPWLGGEYKLAKNQRVPLSSSKETVNAFPEKLRRSHEAGLLIYALDTNTPAAAAGLLAGDLMVEADHRPIVSLRAFGRFIDGRRPGEVVPLRVYRAGELIDLSVTLGRETYRRERTLGVGLLLSSKVDLVPNPDFSLIAAGFKNRTRRLELQSPETKFLLQTRAEDHQAGCGLAREGWRAWLAIVSFGSHKRILSQELVSGTGQLQAALP